MGYQFGDYTKATLNALGDVMSGSWRAINNIGEKVVDGFQAIGKGISNAYDDLNNWGQNLRTSIMNNSLFDGNFEGISAQGIEELKDRIRSYCNEIEGKINTFNANAQINNSIRGANLEPAVQEYVKAIKELLAAYVSVMRQNVDYATKAYAAYENVQSNAESIRKQASNIKLN